MFIDFLVNLDVIACEVENEANVSAEEAKYWSKTVIEALFRCTGLSTRESFDRLSKAVRLLRQDIAALPPASDFMLLDHLLVIVGQIEAELEELRSFTGSNNAPE